MKKFNVEFAYYDPDGREPFNGVFDDPINDDPIEAESEAEAEEIGRGIAEEQIIAMNQDKNSGEIQNMIETFQREHIARAIEITE